MIVTVTFNPALDVSGDVEEIVPDEKTYVHGEKHAPGGNGINAGVIASRLGAPVILTGFLGGTNGAAIRDLLRAEALRLDFVPIKASTRMNVTVSNRKTHRQTRLSFPGPAIRPAEKVQLARKLRRSSPSLVVFGGSLPKAYPLSDVAHLLRALRTRKIPFVVDMPGKSLKQLLKLKPLLIKPNLTEFQELTGTTAKSIPEVLKTARKLLKHADHICVSSVDGGALLVTKTEAWWGKIPRVKIRSTVGAGDSMVGAMASLLARDPQTPPEVLLRVGLAASCATLTERGVLLGKRAAIEKYKSRITLRALRQ